MSLFDGPLAGVAAAAMQRMNRAAEVEAVERLAPRPADHVLAVGFGPGVGVALLADRLAAGKVIGVDPSAAMVRLASRANRVAVAAGRVVLHEARAESIPEPDASFDGAVAVNAIQFCHPLAPAAGELARVLKPGACLVTLTHDWALERRAGSVEAWAAEAEAVFSGAGFDATSCFRGRAESGRIVVFTARRASP